MLCKFHRAVSIPRRRFLTRSSAILAGSLFSSVIPGCKSDSKTTPSAALDSPTAPLRVALIGDASDAETIRRSWSAVSDQPLAIEQTELDRAIAIETEPFLQSAKRSDVIVYPLALVGQAASQEAVTGFSENDTNSIQEQAGSLLAAVRNSSQFGGERVAIPIGARLPAVHSSVPMKTLETWAEFHQWVQDDLGGAAAEPLAPGWAGTMFLWRAASSIEGTWLFGRESLDPAIDSNEYVGVLEQMKETASVYGPDRLSPQMIWQQLADGQLKAGIGFPFTPSIDGISTADLPNQIPRKHVLMDMYSPVVSISAGCRQSAVAKQFVGWLCGGDGSENLRRQIPSITITRQPRVIVSGADGQEQGGYQTWLRNQLGNSSTLAPIQIHRATEYYVALDSEVRSCLDGDKSPKEALIDAAQRWRKITSNVGVDVQTRAWRRAQGMRS